MTKLSALKTPDSWKPVAPSRLRYIDVNSNGFARKKVGKQFVFFDDKGKKIADEKVTYRIRRLVLPPAWKNVWICPHDNGRIQATGIDARGRKQYRYHESWRKMRDENEFKHILEFAALLPKIRKSVDEDLATPKLTKRKVVATVVKLLELTFIRVGNEEYAKSNNSFGLTTLRDKHVSIRGSVLDFKFRGKSGVYHKIQLNNKSIARIVKKCRDEEGSELFQFEDEDGSPHPIDSSDVNAYLKEITGSDVTAKDFRTWSGTVLAALALHEFEHIDKKTQVQKNVLRAIESVAARLGNTPSVCRKCYVHPAIIESYVDGSLLAALKNKVDKQFKDMSKLSPTEAAVVALLERRLSK